MKTSLFCALAGAFAAAAFACAAAQESGERGSVVLAKAAPDAVFVWDASPVVARIVSTKDTAGMQALEAQAARIMVEKAPVLARSARSVAVNVIYARSGAVSPVYNAVTFSGFERVFSIRASRADIAGGRVRWDALLRQNRLPPQITLTISGRLPPIQ